MEEESHIVDAGGVRGVFRIVGHLHQLVYLVVGSGCSYVWRLEVELNHSRSVLPYTPTNGTLAYKWNIKTITLK